MKRCMCYALVIASIAGCARRAEKYESTLGEDKNELVVAIIFDLSGSFRMRWWRRKGTRLCHECP